MEQSERRVAGRLTRSPGGTTDNGTHLPEEAKNRIEPVREAGRADYISHDVAAKLIADIVAEYT